tara:strand:- start:208 stop:441 length:234 start_codon:yes stop_codon:yes gene_type:complete
MAKTKKDKDPIDMVLDLIDTINESIKNLHDRIDNTQEQVTKLTEATKLSSKLHAGSNDVDKEIINMVNRMADRMGMK